MADFIESDHPRSNSGSFSAKEQASPEVSLVTGQPGYSCFECGGPIVYSAYGVANHLTIDGSIDHDTDADHVAFDDAICSDCGARLEGDAQTSLCAECRATVDDYISAAS